MKSAHDHAVSTSSEGTEPILPPNTAREIPARSRRVLDLFAGGMFVRYLITGGINTLAGYSIFVLVLHFLGEVIGSRYLYLATPLASLISTPVNITIAYLGYKFLVFRTRGNYLMEWLKCFAVYGTSMIPGLLALGALTRLFQGLIHQHASMLRALLGAVEAHLAEPLLHVIQRAAGSKNIAGNLAGAVVMGFTTIYSFIGHRKVTFRPDKG